MTVAKRTDQAGPPIAFAPWMLLWCGRILVIALLLYAPWYYGMVTWTQQLLLLPWTTAILGCSWGYVIARPELRVPVSPLLVCLLILIGLAVLQVVPLPRTVFDAVAPAAALERESVRQAAEYLGMDPEDPVLQATSRESGPIFQTLSIHPLQTRASLVGLTAATILFLSCGILFQDKVGKLVLLVALCLVTTAAATVGILQNISWNQWTLLEMPHQNGFATFVSRNSAPQYFAIGLGSSIALSVAWLAHKRRKSRHDKRYRGTTAISRMRFSLDDTFREIDAWIILLIVALLLQIGGVVGAASRGGIVSLLFAMVVTLFLTLGRNRRLVVPGILGFMLVGLISLFFVNSFELSQEISQRIETVGFESPGRLEYWKLALGQSEYWWTGSGLGSFHFAFLPSNVQYSAWIYHAESIYVELISNFGWIGAFTGLVGLVWLVRRLVERPDRRSTTVWPAVLYATSAIALQSTVDFSLILPSVFLSLAALVGAYMPETCRPSHATRKSESPRDSKTVDRSSRSDLPKDRRRNLPVFSKLRAATWTLVSVGMLMTLWQGAKPLAGFAQAEKIEHPFWSNSKALSPNSDFWLLGYDVSHPEVVLQLARHKVNATEEYLRDSFVWPENIPTNQREQLTQLEFVSAITRSKEDDQWQALRQRWNSDPNLGQALEASRSGFQFASRFCPLDWRGHWGLLQSDVSSDPIQHALTASRLKRLSSWMPQMQQAVGTCSLLAGDRTIGLDYWKSSLVHHPHRTNHLATLVGTLINKEDIERVIPEAQIPKAALGRVLVNQTTTREIGQQLIAELELKALSEEAENEADWELVVWICQSRGDLNATIEALRSLANLKPMDKGVRMNLAKALESRGEAGDTEEAVQHLEQAGRRTRLSAADEAYLQRLKRGN